MVNRLPSWVFLSIALIVMGIALLPVLRTVFGIDTQIKIQFLTFVSLLIGGLMCGLTAMILMARRQPNLNSYRSNECNTFAATKLHATGLLIFTGIPLANFLACYVLWVKYRSESAYLDYQGREAICFQITIYLYLIVCLFMAYAIVGIFVLPVLLAFHFLATLGAIMYTSQQKPFRYPANISIIARAPVS